MHRRQLLKKSALAALGISLGPSLLLSLESCARERPTSMVPSSLDQEQFDLIWVISDLILPRTETPGAIDSAVPPFIDKLYGVFMEADEKEFFSEGLSDFVKSCEENFGKQFLDLEPDAQIDYLKSLDEQRENQPFFNRLKQIVLWAHFTSEPGMKSMNYLPVPGRYDGCIKVGKDEKNIVGNR